MSSPLWSESAFGVVHKSYTKMAPKLARARKAIGNHNKTTDMDSRMRSNYVIYRNRAGDLGRSFKGTAQGAAVQQKKAADASLKAVQNINRRRDRTLP